MSKLADNYYNIDEDEQISDMVRKSAKLWSDPNFSQDDIDDKFQDYHRYWLRKILFIVVCFTFAFVSVGISITIGPSNISFWDTYRILWEHITGNIQDRYLDYIIVQLRMPANLTALVAGAGLAACGVTMQSVMKNPLADPYTTGVSSGAGFGASLALAYNISLFGAEYALVGNAFLFALIPTAIIVLVSKFKNASPTTMIMAGIAVMYIFNAGTTIIKLWADDETLSAIFRWQVGSVAGATYNDIALMAIVVVIGIILLQILARKINLLSTGDDNAKAMGVNAERLRIICLIIVALVSASVVCFTGLIGFIGLVAPHIVRIFIGPDNRYLLVASSAFGASLLVLAYMISVTLVAPITLQVGVVTSLLGGPMFLWLILKKNSRVWG